MDDPTDDPFGSQAGATNYAGQLTSEEQSPPQVLETPDQTEARVAQQQRQTQQVWQSVQAVKAKDLQTAAIPSYTDSSGTTQPVTDSTGAAVTDYDKKNNVGWDSAGNPVQVKQNVNAPPSVEDAFSDTSVTTDPKTGNQYKIRAGLPWQYQGQDQDIAAQNLQNDQDKAVSNAAGALGRKLTLDERQFHFDNTAFAHQTKTLASQFGLDGSEDLAGAQKKISDSFNNTVDGYGSPQANETQGYFGSGPLTPEAQAYRAGIDQKKAAALQQASDLNDTQQDLATRKVTLDQQQTQRTALAQMQVDAANRKLAAAGVELPGAENATDTGSSQTDNTVSRGTIPQTQPGPPSPSQQALQDAADGKKNYGYNPTTGIQFKPDSIADGLKQAVADGVVDKDWAAQHQDEFQAAQDKYNALEKAAGGAQQLKALLHGAGLGAAFWGGSLPGAKIGAGIAAAIPGVGESGIGELVGGAIGGLTTGTIAAFAAHKALDKLADYSDAVKSLNSSAELHPVLDAAGQLAGMSLGAPEAIANVAKAASIAKAAGTTADAVKLVAKIAGAGAAGGAVFEGAVRPLFDVAKNAVLGSLGIDHDAVQPPTVSSLVTNAALGIITAGHNIEFRNYTAAQVADIMVRAKVRQDAGIPLTADVGVPDMVAAYKAKGVDLDSDHAPQMTKPLTPLEQQVYLSLAKKTLAMQQGGQFDDATGAKFTGAQQAIIPNAIPGHEGTPITAAGVEAERGGASGTPAEPAKPPTPPVAAQLATAEAQPSPVESAESLQAERAAIVRAGAGSPELQARIAAIDAKLANIGATAAAPGTPTTAAPTAGTAAKSSVIPGVASPETTGTGVVTPSGAAPTVDDAAHEAATSPVSDKSPPTQGQLDANNYQMGHPNVGGLPITIEHPIGSKRFPDGPALTAHYGYVKGTVGAEGDHIDAFVKGGTPTDYKGPVFVVNQNKRDGTFDEHKAVIGANSPEEAKEIYDRQYKPGTARAGTIATFSTPTAFKEWAEAGQKTTPAVGDVDLQKVQPKEPNANQVSEQPGDAGAVQQVPKRAPRSEVQSGGNEGAGKPPDGAPGDTAKTEPAETPEEALHRGRIERIGTIAQLAHKDSGVKWSFGKNENSAAVTNSRTGEVRYDADIIKSHGDAVEAQGADREKWLSAVASEEDAHARGVKAGKGFDWSHTNGKTYPIQSRIWAEAPKAVQKALLRAYGPENLPKNDFNVAGAELEARMFQRLKGQPITESTLPPHAAAATELDKALSEWTLPHWLQLHLDRMDRVQSTPGTVKASDLPEPAQPPATAPEAAAPPRGPPEKQLTDSQKAIDDFFGARPVIDETVYHSTAHPGNLESEGIERTGASPGTVGIFTTPDAEAAKGWGGPEAKIRKMRVQLFNPFDLRDVPLTKEFTKPELAAMLTSKGLNVTDADIPSQYGKMSFDEWKPEIEALTPRMRAAGFDGYVTNTESDGHQFTEHVPFSPQSLSEFGARPVYDEPIPDEKMEGGIKLARRLRDMGINTPEALAQDLAAVGPKATKHTQALWHALKMVGAKGPAEPNWPGIYGAKEAPAKTVQEKLPFLRPAFKMNDGEIVIGKPGVMSHPLMGLSDEELHRASDVGFVDRDGKFLNRKEAHDLSVKKSPIYKEAISRGDYAIGHLIGEALPVINKEATGARQEPAAAPAAKTEAAPSFKTAADVARYTTEQRAKMIAGIQREYGLSEPDANRVMNGLYNEDSSDSQYDRAQKILGALNLSDERVSELEKHPEIGDNGSIMTPSNRFKASDVAEENDAASIASTLVNGVRLGRGKIEHTESHLATVAALFRAKEIGMSWSDIARYIDDFTTRNSGSQSDKTFLFKEIADQIKAFAKEYSVSLPSGDLAVSKGGMSFKGLPEPAPAAPKRTFRRKIPEPAGGHDLIESVLSDIGKITHPETARRDALRQEGKTVFNRTIERGGQYDGWMNLPSQLRSLIFGKIGATGHSDPDEAAQVAYDHGLIREPTPEALREAILSAWKTRLSLRAAERAQNIERKGEGATKQRQDADFAKDSKTPAAGAESIKADDMNVGDVVDVAGQQLRVIDVDPDSGEVTLEDHSKYGVQHVEEGHFIYGEIEKPEPEGSGFDTGEEPETPPTVPKLRPGEKGTSDLFQGSDAPFNLMGEAGVDTVKQAAEKEAAVKRAEEAKKIQDSQQLDIFNPQSNVTPETQPNDLSTGSSVEPDREGAGLGESSGQGGVPAEPGATGEAGRSLDGSSETIPLQSGLLSDDVPSAPYRSPGDRPVREPASAVSERPSRDVESGGGGRTNDGGLSPLTPGPKDAHAPLVVPGESSAVAGGSGAGEGEYHSALTPEQRGDVQFIERRLAAKPGVLITNGTGTGKTFSGLGAVHRALARGAEHILVVAPSDKIGSDWTAAAKEFFGIRDIKQLESTSENGSGNRIAVATYANLGQNDSLVRRPWQMIVADEAHYLSQAQEGNKTNALDNFRALTFHPQGHFARARMMEPEAVKRLAEIAEATKRNRTLGPTFESEKRALSNKLDDARARSQKHAATLTDATKPKALMMSATPFAYHFSLDYGEGYLFDYPPEDTKSVGRYNHPSPRSQFYMENFGYRMRTGKLTKPENAVATGILERRFAEKLMKDGSMSGRALVVPHDYSRDFILTENAIGAKIDEVMAAIDADRSLSPLRDHLDISDYLARRFLLESLKARDAIPRIQKHLAMGRKIVVFHDYKKGGGQNPLRVKFAPDATANVYTPQGNKAVPLGQLYEKLRAAVPGFDDTVAALDKLESPLVSIAKAFPDAGIFNGDVPSKKRRQIVNDFNTSGGKMNVILVQRASGKEGISLHDKDGKHQRVFMDLGIPGRPTDAIQSEGRIYRHGVKSNAVDEYLVTGTNFERWTFAQTIAQRASTAENLAMGERARSLLQSFASGFNDAALKEPSAEQGTGGKAMDSAREHGDPYSNAVALYYTNAKKTSRNKSAEGIDYFPTPEPVGFKMTEWGGIRPGEKVLEPSAGHGAIARFFPDATNRHAVEPSNELAGRLALNAPDTEVHNMRFEDFNTANKFNVVAMNPPFGTAGKTAMDHLEKAVQHLREGGRIVALIPRGASMDKRFEKWYESDGAKGIHLRAEFLLPSVAFERAGTSVSARIVVLDKSNPLKDQPAQNLQQQDTRDLTDAKDIKELFARLKDLGVPDRPTPPKVAAADPAATTAPVPKNPATLPAQVSATIPKPTSESDYSPAEFLHTRDNVPVFVAKAERYMARDEFTANRTRATQLGGHYSNFKGAGAVPGFHFKTAEARDRFISGSAEPQQFGARPPDPEAVATAAATAAQPGRSNSAADRRAAAAATARATMPLVEKLVARVKVAGEAIRKAFVELPEVTDYKAAKGQWLGAGEDAETGAKGLQRAAHEARMMSAAVKRAVPNPVSRMAISRYIEADGDMATLKQQAADAAPKYAPLYQRAMDLSPEEKAIADTAKKFFNDIGQHAVDLGILSDMLEGYVAHFVDQSSIPANARGQKIAQAVGDIATSRMKTRFDRSIRRVFANMFDLEKQGYRLQSSDIAEVMAAYAQEMNNVISARTFIKQLPALKAVDGRPLAVTSGYARQITDDEGKPDGPLLVKPFAKPQDARDYLPIDHPALRKYKWVAKDAEGNPVFSEGELLIHPDIHRDLSNTLGQSALNKAPMIRAVSDFQHQVKNMMLGWSLFHYVQEGTHAIGHGVNPFKLHAFDPNDPTTRELINGGLMLINWDAKRDMAEGLGGHGGLLSKIPGLGPLNDQLTSFLFEQYIPGLKAEMAKHAFERNLDRFKKELASGKITRAQVAQKTAQQANDAFGEQNTRYTGENPTKLHAERMAFLAPDFLKSRAKFFADAFTKYGSEQRRALFILAMTMAVTAKLLERMLTGRNNWKNPFSVKTDTREFELRSVPGDVLELMKSPRWFISGRLSPLISRTALEAITGRDYRGMKRTPGEQIMDLLKEPIPMSVRGAIDKGAKAIDPTLPKSLRGKLTTNTSDITGGEQVASAAGARIKRSSDITDARILGHEWRQKQGLESDDTVYPPSKYVSLKNALEDRDIVRAKSEFDFLVKENAGIANAGALAKGFRESMNRPFSGAAKTENAFVASLDKTDRATYDRAVASRNRIISQFTQVAGPAKAAKPMFEGFPE